MKATRLLAVLLTFTTLICACNSNDNQSNNKLSDEKSRKLEMLKKDYFGLKMSWLEFNEYKGEIKSLKTIKYNAYGKFGEVTLDSIIDEEYIEFNKEGFITVKGDTEYTYEINDKCRTITSRRGDSITKREIHNLNANGFPTQSDSYGSAGELTERIKYKYDNKGRLIEKISYDKDGKATHKLLNVKYGSNGLPTSWEDYTANASGKKKLQQHTYYPNGYLKEILITEDDCTNAQILQEVENNKTKKITVNNFNKDGNIWLQSISIYNKKEELVEMSHYNDKKLVQHTKYEYDSIGNIIKTTEFEYEEPVAVNLIEIEYYK